ncbi:hypothetical protein M885DRAFT_483838 [Pelagophyceae sp. CCMP2097]|nr:hypothetical protein M885DRAFT_483838 [Pelagophyceae sp. CCMP2097]|mmetsp:Transcript_16844/g.56931  ORF Transcript_16844/g.56931 Transcript_16844/m.56931 type:complete len:408 (-) Transcript_16844:50-1273(-)
MDVEDFMSFSPVAAAKTKDPGGRVAAADVPWAATADLEDRPNPLVALHNEILAFVDLVSLGDDEETERRDSLNDLRAVVKSIWPDAATEVFGSQLTELYLPSSDIDVVVFGAPGTDKAKLHRLAAELTARNLAANMEVVDSARIPIVKFEHANTGVAFDVSFDVESGLRTGRVIKDFMKQLPALRAVVMVLKYFLNQRELNETYSGGMGSYMTQLLVVSFLQMRLRTDHATNFPSVPNLGALLLEFFELYSRDFNFVTTGICVRGDGSYFPKQGRGWFYQNRPMLLAIENPDDAKFDVGKNSFAINRIKRAFEQAHLHLTVALTARDWDKSSLLASIIYPDDPALAGRTLNAEVGKPARKRAKHEAPPSAKKAQSPASEEPKKKTKKKKNKRKRKSDDEDDEIEGLL